MRVSGSAYIWYCTATPASPNASTNTSRAPVSLPVFYTLLPNSIHIATGGRIYGSLRSDTGNVSPKADGFSCHWILTPKVTPLSRVATLSTVKGAAPTKRCGAWVVIGGCPSLAVITTTESCLISTQAKSYRIVPAP